MLMAFAGRDTITISPNSPLQLFRTFTDSPGPLTTSVHFRTFPVTITAIMASSSDPFRPRSNSIRAQYGRSITLAGSYAQRCRYVDLSNPSLHLTSFYSDRLALQLLLPLHRRLRLQSPRLLPHRPTRPTLHGPQAPPTRLNQTRRL